MQGVSIKAKTSQIGLAALDARVQIKSKHSKAKTRQRDLWYSMKRFLSGKRQGE